MPSAAEWATGLRTGGTPVPTIKRALRNLGVVDEAGRVVPGMLDRDVDELLAERRTRRERPEGEPAPADILALIRQEETAEGRPGPPRRRRPATAAPAGPPPEGTPARPILLPAVQITVPRPPAPTPEPPPEGTPEAEPEEELRIDIARLRALPTAAQKAVRALPGAGEATTALGILERTQKAGIDVSDPDRVAYALRDVGPLAAGEQEVREILPAAARRLTVVPAGRAAGLAVGGFVETAKMLGDALEYVAPSVFQREQGAEDVASRVAETFDATERDLQARLAASEQLAGYVAVGPVVGPRATGPLDTPLASFAAFVDDARTDMRDVLVGLYDMLVKASGLDVEGKALRKGFLTVLREQYAEGTEYGELLAAGAVGGTAALAADLPAALEARPFSTMLVLLPFLKRVPAGKLTPPMKRVLKRAALMTEIAAKKLSLDDVARFVMRKVFGGRRIPGGEIYAAVRRWLADSMAQADAGTEALVERIMTAGPEDLATIRGAIEQLAVEVEAGRLGPKDVFRPVQYEPSSAVPIEERIRLAMAGRAGEAAGPARPRPPSALEQFSSIEGLWKKATTHEEPVVRAAVGHLTRRLQAARDRLWEDVNKLRPVQHALDALTEPAAVADFLKARAVDLARLARRERQLALFETGLARAKAISEGPAVLHGRRAGPPVHRERFDISEEFIKGQRRDPIDVIARRDELDSDTKLRYAVAKKYFTEEELRAEPKLASSQVLVQIEPQRRVLTPETIEPTLAHPGFRAIVADLIAATDRIYRGADLAVKEPGSAQLMRYVRTRLAREGLDLRTGADVLRTVTSVLRDDSTQILRSPKMRKRVIARVRKKAPELSEEGIERNLLDMGEAHLLDDVSFNYVIDLGGGRTVNLFDELIGALDEGAPKFKQEVRAEALRRLGVRLGTDAAEARFGQAIVADLERFNLVRGTTLESSRLIVDRVLVNDEPPPIVLGRASGSDLGADIASLKEEHIATVVAARGWSKIYAARRVEELISRMNNDYTKPMAALAERLPEAAAAPTALRPSRVSAEPAEFGHLGIKQVSKGFNSTAGWLARATSATAQADDFLSRMKVLWKFNLTGFNLPTWVNNLAANTSFQALRRGKTPVGIVADLVETARTWSDYKKGRIADPALLRLLRGIEKSGLVDTTLVDAEIGSLELPTLLSPQASRLLKPWQALQKAAGAGYKWGDNIFKLDDAIRAGQQYYRMFDGLAAGEALDIPVTSRRILRVSRSPEDNLIGAVRGRRQGPRAGAWLDGDQLVREIARAAGESARAIFFDYRDVPNWISFLRWADRGVGIVSPFVTWSWKALDIPGIKRGLLGQLLLGDAGASVLWTNNAALKAALLRNAGATALRRAMLLGALRADIVNQDADKVRDVARWLPADSATVLLQNITDPGNYFGFKDMARASSFEPTETLFRVGIGAFVQASEWLGGSYSVGELYPEIQPPWLAAGEPDTEMRNYPEEERAASQALRGLWAKNQTGELWAAADVIQLAGLAGHPLIQAIAQWNEGERRGEDFSFARVVRDYGAVLIGGLPHKVFDVLAGAYDPYSALSTRQFALSDDPAEREEFIRWAVRKVTSLGWRVKGGEKAVKDYTQRVGRTLRASVSSAARKRMEALKKDEDAGRATADEVAAAERAFENLEEIVKNEIERIEMRYDEVAGRLRPARGGTR